MATMVQNSRTVPGVAVIGCGNIGSYLDEADPFKPYTLTHAGTYSRIKDQLSFLSLCDPNQSRLETAGKTWNSDRLYTDLDDLFESEDIDIVSICTPTSYRLPVFRAALQRGIKYFICEKPLASSLQEASQIIDLIDAHQAIVCINYLRRWENQFVRVKEMIHQGLFGNIQFISAYYGKGIINNGSHILDLMNYYFGAPHSYEVTGIVTDDRVSFDPTLSCTLNYYFQDRQFPLYLIASDYRDYSLFEIDIVGSVQRMRVFDNGLKMNISKVAKSDVFRGYQSLSEAELHTEIGLHAFKNMIEEFIAIYRSEEKSVRCTVREGKEILDLTSNLILKKEHLIKT
ncbi:MAG: Gfo/Idh/MocA family oxidoreductase [Saprospiraceae bacterium]|nr:Gfo/Idh/MocA family oxidoreductase [Saprospiraceae bacterium]